MRGKSIVRFANRQGNLLHCPPETEAVEEPRFYFLLEIEGRDPYIVAPHIAKQRRRMKSAFGPILIVRYVTMAGEEGLWPLKLEISRTPVEPVQQVGSARA